MKSERLARIERWYLRAGLFILPLAYSWGTYDAYVLPKLMVVRLLVIGLLGLFIAKAMVARSIVVKRTPLDLPLLVFVGSAALSTIFAYNQNVAVFGTYARYDGRSPSRHTPRSSGSRCKRLPARTMHERWCGCSWPADTWWR